MCSYDELHLSSLSHRHHPHGVGEARRMDTRVLFGVRDLICYVYRTGFVDRCLPLICVKFEYV